MNTAENSVAINTKQMNEILNEYRSRVAEFEMIVNRLYGIEERLQGGRPEEDSKAEVESSNNYLSELNHQSARLCTIRDSMDSIICNLETIL